MKKHLIMVGVAILLLTVGLSGCTEETSNGVNDNTYLDEEDKFIGPWINEDGNEIIYASNGSYYSELVGWVGTWELKDGKLFVNFLLETDQNPKNYTFSNNYNKLTLEYSIGDYNITSIFTRKQ